METKSNLNIETPELNSAPNTMSCEFIQTLINNYRNNHLAFVRDRLGIDDAHSIHFDLDTLKKFISDIENETRKNAPNITDQDLGIRFYYAAYPKKEDWDIMKESSIGPEYAERHTLVMVPTMMADDGEGNRLPYDFNPLSTTGEGELLAMASVRNSRLEGDIISQNHGVLNPPNNIKVETF